MELYQGGKISNEDEENPPQRLIVCNQVSECIADHERTPKYQTYIIYGIVAEIETSSYVELVELVPRFCNTILALRHNGVSSNTICSNTNYWCQI